MGYLKVLSSILGVTYTICWNVCWYPQLYRSFSRKSCDGFSQEYAILNFLGYAYYTIFTLTGMIDSTDTGIVAWEDILFAVHSYICTAGMWTQTYVYPRGKQKISTPVWIYVAFSNTIFTVMFFLQIFLKSLSSKYYGFIAFCGYLKTATTLLKYLPQLLINVRVKSTEGFNILLPLMDFVGGVTSMFQLFVDEWEAGADNPFTSPHFNIAKFGVGFASILYNIVFFVQHFCVYRGRSTAQTQRQNLLNQGDTHTLSPDFQRSETTGLSSP